MSEAHARLSPSSPRWVHCPGAPREEAAYPRSSGAAAIDGTGSHLLLETCLLTRNFDLNIHGVHVGRTIGVGHEDKPGGWLVKADRCDRVKLCFDYVKDRSRSLGGVRIDAEDRSNPGKYFGRDDWWGTCDVTLTMFVAPGVLEVIDYKDGQSYVDVKSNSQLIGYAAGKLAKYIFDQHGKPIPFDVCGITKIRMTIVQPKITKNPIRYVEMTPQKLWEKATELAAAAKLTDDPEAPLIAGDWCTWCPHLDNCSEHQAQGMEALNMLPVTTTVTDQVAVKDMSGDKLSEIMGLKKTVDALFKKVDAEITTRVNKGLPVPFYMKGKGRGSNEWVDDAEKKLLGMGFSKTELHPPSFITPAAALAKEGLTDRRKKKIEDELIKYVAGKDKVIRTNISIVSAEEMFASAPKVVNPEEPEDFSTLSFN